MAQKLETDKAKSLREIFAKISEVAVLPQVVHKVIEISDSEDGSPADIEKAVEIDPGFCTKLIAMANSAQYSLPRRITSIREASMMLGFKQIRELALNAGVFDFFVGKNDKESLRRRDWWRLSVDVASMSKWIASQVGINPYEAYTCGLLHIFGKTLIDQSDPTGYDKVMYVVQKGAPERLAERTIFAVDHVDVAQEMARSWRFPEALVEGINYLDDPREREVEAPLAAVVNIGFTLVNVGRFGRPEDGQMPLASWALEILRVDSMTAETWVEHAHQQFLKGANKPAA
ncbi:MAG: HDOD domain-containing protein [Armatimonadetes bacterium]|nr:HDOD domain-containing protein [Armatimonadota bacterium]